MGRHARPGVPGVSAPALDVRGLSYAYPDGTPALRDVSFSVAPGERVGLVGPNGAGKSTLLLHLNGLLPERLPREAAVTVDGIPLLRDTARQVRAAAGLLFEDPDDMLFCATVREDVGFGPEQQGIPEAERAGRVDRALAAVGLAALADRPPHHLSAGEKRRACLAGLLSMEPRVLLLDDPTSGLDPRGRRHLAALLAGLPAAMLIASHDLDFVLGLCSRVLVLDGGALVAEGPAEAVLADEPLMLAHGLERPRGGLFSGPSGSR